MKKGWKGESKRHSLASKGIKSAQKVNDIFKQIPNIKLNINGQEASISKSKDKATAKFGKYTGSVSSKGNDILIDVKKEKDDWLKDLLG